MRPRDDAPPVYEVSDLARVSGLSKRQVRDLLARGGLSRPGGKRTKWRVRHDELVSVWPEAVYRIELDRAERLRRERDAA
ncbi:MAG TPA: hypothetical protein VFS43_38275 [Polyangiaceae bacterium]|nr:hypothetical protein [Polyangiaceae bacterium]